jgi:hypothetical protein
MIQERNKNWTHLAYVSGAHEFETKFKDKLIEQFAQVKREFIDEKEFEKFDTMFHYLLDEKAMSDQEFIEAVLTRVPYKTFALEYSEQSCGFDIYQKADEGFMCPNCDKPLKFEEQIDFNGEKYDKHGCEDCSHIQVLDYNAEANE